MKHFAALLLLLAAQPACADDAFEAIKQVGLDGTWAPTCSAPVSTDNRRHRYYVDENAKARVSFDPGISSGVRTSAIDAASVLAPGTVQLTLIYDDERWASLKGSIWMYMIDVVAGRSQRAMQVTRSDGRVMVKDGVIVSSGKPAPTLEKCDRNPDA